MDEMVFDFGSMTPLEDQAIVNLVEVRKLCLERIEQAKSERRERVKQGKFYNDVCELS